MSDREFLVELFRATKGKFWIRKDNWLSSENCRKWFGVSVNSSGHVHILNLRRNYLQERIDLIVSWRVLSNIQVLCLSENSIQGEIPSRLGDLHSLEELDLSWNEFVGTIPVEIYHLPKLKVLRLEHNRLNGELSIELSNCKRLQFLNLSMNEFSGIIFVLLYPYNIIDKGLMNIRYIGTVPKVGHFLQELKILDLSRNLFEGFVPTLVKDFLSYSLPSEGEDNGGQEENGGDEASF